MNNIKVQLLLHPLQRQTAETNILHDELLMLQTLYI